MKALPGTTSFHGRFWIKPTLALVLIGTLSACATRPSAALPAGSEQLSGRLSVRVAAQGSSAERAVNVAFDLRGRPEAGRIDLSTPLGSIVAQATWSPGEVRLVTPEGERRFEDLDSLSREALGEAIPVAALFDWLSGRPWAGAASERDVSGSGFSQLGWHVDLTRFGDAQVVATRRTAPVVTVRAVLERP